VCENKILKKIFGPKKNEVTGICYITWKSLIKMRVAKSRRIWCNLGVVNVKCNTYRSLTGKYLRKQKADHRDLKEMGCKRTK